MPHFCNLFSVKAGQRFTLLTALLSLCTQRVSGAQVTLNFVDCRTGEPTYVRKVEVLNNGQLFAEHTPKHYMPLVIDLKVGTYTIQYLNFYGQTATDTLQVDSVPARVLSVCLDRLVTGKVANRTFIDMLEVGESYSIQMTSSGCFHGYNDILSVSRDQQGYIMHWDTLTERRLSLKDLDRMRRFEIELDHMSEGGCTTTDTYSILYGRRKRVIVDGHCRWNGWSYLRSEFLGEK